MQTASEESELVDELEFQLRSLATGAPVPSEHELSDRFGVSRSMIRSALIELERRTVLRRIDGGWSFRRNRIDYVVRADAIPSFTSTMRAAGVEPSISLRECRTRRAVELERRQLELERGSRVWEVTRLFSVNGETAAYSTSVLAYAPFPGLDRVLGENGSLAWTLKRRYGVRLSRVRYRIGLSIPGESVAEVLTGGTHTSVFLAESLNRIRGGPPVEYARTYLRTDVVNVVFEVKEGL